MPPPLKLAFLGMSHPFSALLLRPLTRRPHHLSAILESFLPAPAQPPAGTHLQAAARRRKIPYLAITQNRSALADFLCADTPDLLIVAGSTTLLTKEEFSIPRLGAINIHPSLLPLYRGPQPLFWQYRRFDLNAGVTLHAINAGADTGDILAQLPLPISLGEPYADLLLRAAELGVNLLTEILHDIAAGRVRRQPQRHLPCPQYARFPTPADRTPDFTAWSLDHTWHFLAGLQDAYQIVPAPSPTTAYRIGARIHSKPFAALPGTLLTDSHGPYLTHPQGQIRLTLHNTPQRLSLLARLNRKLAYIRLWH